MDIRTKQVKVNPDNFDEVYKHPEFLCHTCANMAMEGTGAEWNGIFEYYFMACKKQIDKFKDLKSVDPLEYGPDDEENNTSIIVKCDGYERMHDEHLSDLPIFQPR